MNKRWLWGAAAIAASALGCSVEDADDGSESAEEGPLAEGVEAITDSALVQKFKPIFWMDEGTKCAPSSYNGDDNVCVRASSFQSGPDGSDVYFDRKWRHNDDSDAEKNLKVYWKTGTCHGGAEYRIMYSVFFGKQECPQAFGLATHGHDWERIIVVLNNRDRGGEPWGVLFSYHSERRWVPWNQLRDANKLVGNRPNPFIGKHFHGMYPNPMNRTAFSCLANIGVEDDARTHDIALDKFRLVNVWNEPNIRGVANSPRDYDICRDGTKYDYP